MVIVGHEVKWQGKSPSGPHRPKPYLSGFQSHECGQFHPRKTPHGRRVHHEKLGKISTTSPRTRKRPRWKSMSLRSKLDIYQGIEQLVPEISWPGRRLTTLSKYSLGDPKPADTETEATTMTSFRSRRADVAERSLSISSLTELSSRYRYR